MSFSLLFPAVEDKMSTPTLLYFVNTYIYRELLSDPSPLVVEVVGRHAGLLVCLASGESVCIWKQRPQESSTFLASGCNNASTFSGELPEATYTSPGPVFRLLCSQCDASEFLSHQRANAAEGQPPTKRIREEKEVHWDSIFFVVGLFLAFF